MGLFAPRVGKLLLSVQDRPGGDDVSPRDTVAVKPAMLETEIVEDPACPGRIPMAVGLAATA